MSFLDVFVDTVDLAQIWLIFLSCCLLLLLLDFKVFCALSSWFPICIWNLLLLLFIFTGFTIFRGRGFYTTILLFFFVSFFFCFCFCFLGCRKSFIVLYYRFFMLCICLLLTLILQWIGGLFLVWFLLTYFVSTLEFSATFG